MNGSACQNMDVSILSAASGICLAIFGPSCCRSRSRRLFKHGCVHLHEQQSRRLELDGGVHHGNLHFRATRKRLGWLILGKSRRASPTLQVFIVSPFKSAELWPLVRCATSSPTFCRIQRRPDYLRDSRSLYGLTDGCPLPDDGSGS